MPARSYTSRTIGRRLANKTPASTPTRATPSRASISLANDVAPQNSISSNSVPDPIMQTDLRFSPQFADQFRNIDRAMVNGQGSYQSELNNLSQTRERGVYDTERMGQAARRALTQRMADQGILRSGINVGARSDLNTDIIGAVDGINQQYNQGVSGANQNLARFMADINAQREAARFGQARDETQIRLQEEERRATAAAQLQYAQMLQELMNGRQLGNQLPPSSPVGIDLSNDIDPRVQRAIPRSLSNMGKQPPRRGR